MLVSMLVEQFGVLPVPDTLALSAFAEPETSLHLVLLGQEVAAQVNVAFLNPDLDLSSCVFDDPLLVSFLADRGLDLHHGAFGQSMPDSVVFVVVMHIIRCLDYDLTGIAMVSREIGRELLFAEGHIACQLLITISQF